MGLPRKLKNMMMFNAGTAWIGEVRTVTLPPLTRQLENYRGGGMDSAVKIDMGGGDAMALEFTCGGPMRDVLRQYGIQSLDGVYLRFVGAYQKDDTGEVDSVEVIVRGRYEEIDMGEAEPGAENEFSGNVAIAYYKLVWNGRTEIEIDPVNMVLIVDGVDRLAAQRNALGI